MHFSGPIVRPQTDADSLFIEVTVGCTHNSCRFCNFYEGVPFRMAKLEDIESDLKEAKGYLPTVRKIWANGGNPFVMSTEKQSSSSATTPKPASPPTRSSRISETKRWTISGESRQAALMTS